MWGSPKLSLIYVKQCQATGHSVYKDTKSNTFYVVAEYKNLSNDNNDLAKRIAEYKLKETNKDFANYNKCSEINLNNGGDAGPA